MKKQIIIVGMILAVVALLAGRVRSQKVSYQPRIAFQKF